MARCERLRTFSFEGKPAIVCQCLVLFVLALTGLVRAQERLASAPLSSEQVARVDQVLREELKAQELVGVAVGVLWDGQVAYVQGYGDANREDKIPVTGDTRFNWASNSKPVAAVLAMQLVERRLLDLDADVRTYVPEFPEKQQRITTRQLLSHQSGIPHYSNGPVVPTERQHTDRDLALRPLAALDKFNRSPLLFTPGERVSYSSYAYVLVSAIVERAGQAPFRDQLQTRVIKPLELTSLSYDAGEKGREFAVGYSRRGDKVVRAQDDSQAWKHGAGAFRSNIRDFARWGAGLLNRQLVSQSTESAMWASQTLNNRQSTSWGLGFTVDRGDRGLRVSHGGSQPETRTRMVLYPQRRRGLVLMSNSGYADIDRVSRAVEKALEM